MRNEVTGAILALQLIAIPVAELGTVATGGPAASAAALLYLHWVAPFEESMDSFKLNPIIATAL